MAHPNLTAAELAASPQTRSLLACLTDPANPCLFAMAAGDDPARSRCDACDILLALCSARATLLLIANADPCPVGLGTANHFRKTANRVLNAIAKATEGR